MEPISQGNKKEVKVNLPNKDDKFQVGGAGGIGLVGGVGVKVAKGAFTLIKNLLTGGKKAVSTSTKTVNVTGTNSLKTMYPSSKFKSGIGVRGPLPSYTRSAKEVLKPKVPKSKPVDYTGPNPANKIGAGGNSYSR